MKHRWVGLVCGGCVALASGAASGAPTLRSQVIQHGDMILIGNTLGHECAAGSPAPVVGTVGACGMNVDDTAPDVFWRADAPMAGQAFADASITVAQARSTAVLSLPAGATVTRAYLYWGARRGTTMAPDPNAVIERPGVFNTNVMALGSIVLPMSTNYQSIADVTSLVAMHGSGAYRVSGIESAVLVSSTNDSNYAGWWLVVFYDRPGDPLRQLSLFDGLDLVDDMNPLNTITLTGFIVPNTVFDAKLGVVSYEGDGTLTGDRLFFNGTNIADAVNPANNFFNSSHTYLGAPVSNPGDLPQLTGGSNSMGGIDFDVINIAPQLMPGDSSATIQATTTGDRYILGGFVTSITTFRPEFDTSTKTATDINGGALLPGDILAYTMVVTNTGNDTAVGTVLKDPLPMGVTYVPGSTQVTAGANVGPKTDAAGDDQGDYDGLTRTLTVRLGSGADATQGGTMAVGESTTVTFQVTVDPATIGVISNQGIITAGGALGAPPADTGTDGNSGAPGSTPTDVLVDGCATDLDCAVPTPACDVAPNPNLCVECLSDSYCSVPTPTCDLMTKECVCVAGDPTCDPGSGGAGGMGGQGASSGAGGQGGNGAAGGQGGGSGGQAGQGGTGGSGATGGQGGGGAAGGQGGGGAAGGQGGAGGAAGGGNAGGDGSSGSVYVQGGCACTVPAEAPRHAAAWLLLPAAGITLRRRRRRNHR